MSKLYRSLLWSGLVVAGVAACGDDVTVTQPPPPVLTVHSVSVAPTGITIGVGGQVQMVASVNADAGIATTVTWSSGTPAVATVSTSGLVTGVANGPVAITACSTVVTSVCGSATLTVNAAAATVTGVTVTPSTAPMTIGQTLTASASVQGLNNPAQTVTWTSLAPTIATVGATTGVITALASGTAVITACSTLAGFTGVCGSMSVNIPVVTPATVSLQSITWVPQTPGACAPIAGAVPQTVTLTNVNCQVEVTANVNAGDTQLSRLDVLFGGRVVQSQTFPGTAPQSSEPEAASAPVDITLSVNTRQLRDQGGAKVPVIFNGNQLVSVNLYVVGTAAPLASNAVPVVMNNVDAFYVTPGVDLASLQRTAVVAPAPQTVGGNVWFKGTQTASGSFIAYSNTQVTAFNFSASTVCGATTPAGATITGTPTAGLVMTGIFTCAGVEGQNFLGAAPAGVLSYAPAVTGPDGTVLATAGGPPATALTYVNVGSAYQVPTGPIAAPAPENRYNPIALAVVPSGFIDNEGPSVDVASSLTLFQALMGPPSGRAIAADINFDQWWISGGAAGPPITAAFAFTLCNPASSKSADPGGVFTPNCGTSGYQAAADGGVGLASGFPISRATVVAGAVESCTGSTVSTGADLAVTTTSNSNTLAGGGYRVCTYAEDLLANPSSTTLAASSAGLISNGGNKSNVFGVDKLASLARLAGSTAATPATFGAPLAGTHAPVIANNTTIFNIAGPTPATYWGIEGQDDRAGFNQTLAIALRPADQTITRYNATVPAGSIPVACSFNAVDPQLMPAILSDSWVRANGYSLADCGTGGTGTAAGIYEYFGRTWDRANNQSNNIGPTAYWVDLERPNVTGLGFPTNVIAPGAAGVGQNVFSISANDLTTGAGGTLTDGILQFNYPAANFPTGGQTGVAYSFYNAFDPDKWDHVFFSVVNGGPFTLGYYIGRYDETCTGVAATPYASCAAGPAGTLPTVLTNYLSGAAWQPASANANARDAAFNANTAGPGITAPMLASQTTAAGAASTYWGPANTISWTASIAGGVVTANHTTPSSLTLPYFDEVRLFRLGTVAPYIGIWMDCGVVAPGSAGVLVFDNGIQRIWRWTLTVPTVDSVGNVCVGTAAQGNFASGGWRVGGGLTGATLMTNNF